MKICVMEMVDIEHRAVSRDKKSKSNVEQISIMADPLFAELSSCLPSIQASVNQRYGYFENYIPSLVGPALSTI